MELPLRAAASSSCPSRPPPPNISQTQLLPCARTRRRLHLRRIDFPARGAATVAAIAVEPETKVQQNNSLEAEVFACPVCYEPLIRKGPPGLNLPAIYRSGFKCSKCNKSFTSKDVFLDLTVTSGTKAYSELKPVRTELFRSPLVSFLYERGWRQNFNRSGFPGLDEEFKMAQDYFQPVAGGVLVDVSCGSGLFTRKFARSGAYSAVIALDFSENMLRQCYEFIKKDDTLPNMNLALVRADISRLPFASCSIDAIHAGAAIHCWPSPSNAVAEISRVLRPGGVFVATTFLSSPRNNPFSIEALRPLRQKAMGYHSRSLILLFIFVSFYVNESTAISNTNTSFVLAAKQTMRKDPLNGLKYYTGGWNISNDHYWASVGFSSASIFAVAGIWLVMFAVAMFISCCCYCCCRGNSDYSYSRVVFLASLVLLLVSTALAAIGCGILYDGQGKFHGSTTATLDYVVSQSDDTVANLRNFSSCLETAKAAGIDKISLPSDLKGRIDEVVRKVNSSSDELAARTASNANKIRTALETIRKVLIIVASVLLLLALVGFVFSVSGLKSFVYILVILGWILVALTFVLCGTFLLLHNVVGDTCVAMDEWVLHPHDHTALDEILPCVDAAAAAEALDRSKEVNYQLVTVLNAVISNVSNGNFPPPAKPLYYNQSGPSVPLLCNPYNQDLTNRTCAPGEVGTDNAQQVWQAYICRTSVVSGSEICTTVGRITLSMYSQMVSVVNVSHGLYHYGPILADLADCTFVRQTFQFVSKNQCPNLGRYSGRVYQGLLVVSIAVLVSVVLWVVYSRERRRRSDTKKFQVSPYGFSVEENALLKSPKRPYR